MQIDFRGRDKGAIGVPFQMAVISLVKQDMSECEETRSSSASFLLRVQKEVGTRDRKADQSKGLCGWLQLGGHMTLRVVTECYWGLSSILAQSPILNPVQPKWPAKKGVWPWAEKKVAALQRTIKKKLSGQYVFAQAGLTVDEKLHPDVIRFRFVN